ncbi:MAG TPA: hypothetical protein VHR45_07505 [Thermoanaerobaculia bacterium]|nr:hypothetical protein [Thermoanaerobaculia bacterium]
MSPTTSLCQNDTTDEANTFISFPVTCAGAPYDFGGAPGGFSLRAVVCNGAGSCQRVADSPLMPFQVPKAMIPGCIPRESDCGGGAGGGGGGGGAGGAGSPAALLGQIGGGAPGMGGDTSGASGNSCQMCISTGGGFGAGPDGGGPSGAPPLSGPHALLRYAAGGAGNPGFPGSAGTFGASGPAGPWNTTLGRNWAHDYAERIVIDNSTEAINHVWMITRGATFRELTNLAPASGNSLRRYQTVAPADEYRRLFFDPTTSGWQLLGLDGTIEVFQSSGLWDHTSDPSNPLFAIKAHYNGTQLSSVDLPDNRRETYAYYPAGDPQGQAGKLQSITEVGTDSTTSRMWTYLWSGDDLREIDRPDGTAWSYTYGDSNHPGFVTLVRLVATGQSSSRVEAAFTYDTVGNVSQMWRGDPAANGPNAVEVTGFSYNNSGVNPTQALVARQVGAATTYTLQRDTASTKSKVISIVGDCPTCGTTANVTFQYNDAANPFLPTSMTDAKGTLTQYTYNANGRLVSRVEAAGNPLARTTNWQYDTNFPGFPTLVDLPSTTGTNRRQTTLVFNPSTSTLTTRTETGFETGIAGGPAFSKQTAFQYNAVGRVTVIDPPGYGTTDQTIYTYNVPNTNNTVPDSRTDPVVGTTHFTYDAFNRVTSVTDPNGVATLTAYDALNRVTSVTQQGANSPTDDLVTGYSYNSFGDLFQTQLPNGNVIEYGYEPGGLRRLISIERKADPAQTTHGERTLYTLDAIGDRTQEELQHWTGAAWSADDAVTNSVYTTRCHVDKVTRGGTSVTEYSYDCNNNLQQVWDPNHPSSGQTNPASQSYTYDVLNRPMSVTLGPGGTAPATTAYTYDVEDHLASVKDAENNLTSYVTGDRDRMTSQLSPVSGATTYQYNDHGQLVASTDARGIVVNRTIDAADRLTLITYPDSSLNTTYVYDTGTFGKGRLASITRGAQTPFAYTYDRFGRTTQDGALTYGYDKNGNRTTVGYPGGVSATYTYDFANRQATLAISGGGVTAQVTAAAYKPSGPLTSLTFGNGLTETHSFESRYYPTQITATNASAQTLLSWTYTTDQVGNITGITDTLASQNNRAYAYQDLQYFLTTGNGPWGTRGWTYDKIGNRLTESRGGVTDTYTYPQNAPGDNPKLSRVALGQSAGTRFYTYDPTGNEIQVAGPANQLDLQYDAAGKLAKLTEETTRAATYLAYDGRGFLANARQDVSTCSAISTQPTYGSDGLLYDRAQRSLFQPSSILQEARIFYFAGRPVAQLDTTQSTNTLTYLSVDHLGTPILTTNASATPRWTGGFEPFGRDWNGAQSSGEFLRFPGQWEDASWISATASGFEYNLNRWYESPTGRYQAPDPANRSERWGQQLFAKALMRPASRLRFLNAREPAYGYARGNPIILLDPLGLSADGFVGCLARWTIGGAIVGGIAGALAGAGVGAAAGTAVEPGGGTIVGGGAGAVAGGIQGGVAGGMAGTLAGGIVCACQAVAANRHPRHDNCYANYLAETADCGSWHTNDYDYDRCMDNAWGNYLRCLNGQRPKPFIP